MNKNFIFFLILFLLPLISPSQDEKFSFSLQSGASFPLGNFAEKNFDNGSFASTGVSFNLAVQYRAYEHWIFVINTSVNFHSVDATSIIKAEFERDPFLLDLNIRAEPYRSIQLLAGAGYQTDLLKRLTWRTGLLAGVMEARSSFKIYEAEYFMLGQHNFRITSASDFAPSFMAYTEFEFQVKSYFSLLLNTGVSYSDVEFGFKTAQGRRVEEHQFFFFNTSAGFKVYL